jgi:hypothetical protein
MITLEHDNHEDFGDNVYIEVYPHGFYALQYPLMDRIRAIWQIIRGKSYRAYDMIVPWEEFEGIIKD